MYNEDLGAVPLVVRLLVALQRRRLREGLVTNQARVRTFARVHALVPTHARAVAECTCAYGTDVGFLAGVSASVAHQPGQLVEDARAVFAAVAPLQRVHIAVPRECVPTAILATALRALERFLLDVPQLVVAEHALVSEPLVADVAGERPFPGVQSGVDDERFVQLEPFVAHGAFVRFEARVRQLVAT